MMNEKKRAYLNLFFISAVMISFEIISTRISSVIFVNQYAFMVLSLAILGLGSGAVFCFYRIKDIEKELLFGTVARFVLFMALSLILFIACIIRFAITNPLWYFILLYLPFFFAGIVYSLLFRFFAGQSFTLYAWDLAGAASGSTVSLAVFYLFNASNAVLFLSLVLMTSAIIFAGAYMKKRKRIMLHAAVFILMIALVAGGHFNFMGKIPIGRFPEKDFYYVYPGLRDGQYRIVDSRWSLYGRADLVSYDHQNMVKQLFIDGAAGTPLYRFNGDVQNPDPLLTSLLIRYSTAVPFMLLREHERDRMLVIGPGGGKEVLTGLLSGVRQITGVEVNPDFIDIVKEYRSFDGGIYTDFPNVNILNKEGRHYIKMTDQLYDLIVMALPSTEQLQNIDNLAMSENYLLTVEAIRDYMEILTTEGRLILTVHNRWELIRLIVTTFFALEEMGVNHRDALEHIMLFSQDDPPTMVIKKSRYSRGEIAHAANIIRNMPEELPSVTYMPFHWDEMAATIENQLLRTIKDGRMSLREYIRKDQYDISPVHDNSPYFYKVYRGVPKNDTALFAGVTLFALLIVIAPMIQISRRHDRNDKASIIQVLIIFVLIGTGFMILEVSLFQKLVLYLGSPTVSLSMLLGSLLIGMGTGSYYGGFIYRDNPEKRLAVAALLITGTGILSFIFFPLILNALMVHGQTIRYVVSFIIIIPLGFFLGIPFPSAIQHLHRRHWETYIPWMYGVNGIMSVFGSILAVIVSMLLGFTQAFIFGLVFYFAVSMIAWNLYRKA